MKNLTFEYLESKSNKSLIILLATLIVVLEIISSAWDFPYGDDATVNLAQIQFMNRLVRPVHGTMIILGIIFFVIINFFGGDIFFSFNLLNIICSLVFVISIYLIFLNRTESKAIAFLFPLAIFLMPNIWLMMTTHAYYCTAFAFLSLSILFFLKGTRKYLILSGISLGLSLMSNPAIIFITPLFLLLYGGFSKKILKPFAITVGVSVFLLSVWIVLNFNNYLLSGPLNVYDVVSTNISSWSNPINAVLMFLYAVFLNYNLFLPFILICSVLIYIKKKSVIVIALITLLLNYYFWNINYGRYLMPYIVLITIILLTCYLQFYPSKRKLVSVLLIISIMVNFAIGLLGYSIALKNINKEYIDLMHYLINNKKDEDPEIIVWGGDNCLIQYFYPGYKSINLDEYWNRWDILINKLQKDRTYYYIPQSDIPIKAFVRNLVPASLLENAHKIPRDTLSIFTKHDTGNNLKIQSSSHNNVNYYIITKVK